MTATFLLVPAGWRTPVIGVFLEDPRRGIVGFGSACRPDPAAAAAKALSEALVIHSIGRELADPESAFWTAVRAGRQTAGPYRAFRADRAYRSTYRPDWHDLTSLDANVQLHLDPSMQGSALRRLRSPHDHGILAAVPADLAADIAAQGMRAVAVDLTTSDVAAAGLHVARVVVPGAYQLAPAAFPVLGGDRMRPYDAPVLDPLPFA